MEFLKINLDLKVFFFSLTWGVYVELNWFLMILKAII